MKYTSVVIGSKAAGESLKVIERESTPPGPGEIGIQVRRTGVSFGNLMVEDMTSKKPNPKKPTVLGYEIVGTVDAIGPGVTGFREGERVACYTGGQGGYTQYTNWKADDVVHVPDGVDDDAVVCLLLNYMTAYGCLHRVAKVKQGDTALFTGASGGVGTALMELGALAGLSMYGTASRSKHDALRKWGVRPIDYKTEDFVQVIRAEHPEGIEAAIDGVAGGSELACVKVLKRGGVAVSYGMRSINASGSFVFVPIIWGLLRFVALGLLPNGRRTKTYFIDMFKRSHPAEFREDLGTLLRLLAERKLSPVVADVLPLTQARRAHDLLLGGQVTGKLVLDCTK